MEFSWPSALKLRSVCLFRSIPKYPRETWVSISARLSMMLGLLSAAELWEWKSVSAFSCRVLVHIQARITLNMSLKWLCGSSLRHNFQILSRICNEYALVDYNSDTDSNNVMFNLRWHEHRRNCCWSNSGTAASDPTGSWHLVCPQKRIPAK